MKKIVCQAALLMMLVIPAQVRAAEVLQEITVKEGDTIWGIASFYLQDPKRWPEILRHNNLPVTDPSVALPGMKLKVPVLLIKEHLRKANLVSLLNDVRYRRRDQAVWKKALKDMDLFNEDGLRTMDNSHAQVKFFSGDILRLDENSLVILRPELKVEEVNLVSGAIRGARTKLVTPTAQITPQSGDTVYKARIREDKSTIVQVEKGSAEIFGLDTGKKVLLQAGFANITMPQQAPSAPMKVPNLPDFKMPDFTPSGDIVIPSDKDMPTAKMPSSDTLELDLEPPDEYVPSKGSDSGPSKEKGKPGVKSMQWKELKIMVSKDSKFTQVVWEEKQELGAEKPVTSARNYGLPDGKYYRGVTYFDDKGRETNVRSLGSFEIDTTPPKISIQYPPEGHQTREALVSIEGQTDPRCFVTINNYPVSIGSDGKFSWSVVLAKEGPNKIKITARDPAGNRSQSERTIFLVSGASK